MIRSATSQDAMQIARIYNHYIEHTVITFEEQTLDADEMKNRIADVQSGGLPWLVAMEGERLVGYAYATKWRVRSAYRYSVETTIYLDHEMRNRGWGKKLYRSLFEELKSAGFHVALGGIALPNEASVGLHESLGFKKAAHLCEVGRKFGKWIDVGYWQATLSGK